MSSARGMGKKGIRNDQLSTEAVNLNRNVNVRLSSCLIQPGENLKGLLLTTHQDKNTRLL